MKKKALNTRARERAIQNKRERENQVVLQP
jgi:hypothetical protein